MIKRIGFDRLKEILPTIKIDKIYVESYSSQYGYIDGFKITCKGCYITYDIFCFDFDPRYRDDYVLLVLDLFNKDKRIEWVNREKSYYSFAKCNKNLLNMKIGEE